jgi:hypothetical protein
MEFFDLCEDNHHAKKILDWLDNNGIDIYSDDPDYLLVNYSEPVDGVNYYTKVENADGKWEYKLWDNGGVEGDREFEKGVNYFILEAEQKPQEVIPFRTPDGAIAGITKYAQGSPVLTHHYFPTSKSNVYLPVYKDKSGNWCLQDGGQNINEIENLKDKNIYFCNVKNGASANSGNIDVVPILTECEGVALTLGNFYSNETYGDKIPEDTQKFVYAPWDLSGDDYDSTDQLDYDARLLFWDSMYGLYGS